MGAQTRWKLDGIFHRICRSGPVDVSTQRFLAEKKVPSQALIVVNYCDEFLGSPGTRERKKPLAVEIDMLEIYRAGEERPHLDMQLFFACAILGDRNGWWQSQQSYRNGIIIVRELALPESNVLLSEEYGIELASMFQQAQTYLVWVPVSGKDK